MVPSWLCSQVIADIILLLPLQIGSLPHWLFPIFFQALLQKRSMSVIITWLSKLFHSKEPRRRRTLSYLFPQPGIGLFRSCPLPSLEEHPQLGDQCERIQMSYTAALWNIPTFSWLNKSVASALPTWLQLWTCPAKGVLRLKSHPGSLGWTTESHSDVLGLTCLSTYVLPGCKVLKFSVQFVRTFALCHLMLYLGSLFVFECPVFIEPYSLRRWHIWENFKTIKILKRSRQTKR